MLEPLGSSSEKFFVKHTVGSTWCLNVQMAKVQSSDSGSINYFLFIMSISVKHQNSGSCYNMLNCATILILNQKSMEHT